MEVPVYLFTGFLEAGKTKFIQETLEDERFNTGESTLLLLCEMGEEEYSPDNFAAGNVYIEELDSSSQVTAEKLEALRAAHNCQRVLVEFNGMWLLDDLFAALPEGWVVYQEFMFAQAGTFISYNNNMRQLVYDKLKSCELVVFNRMDDSIDKLELHKIVRGVSRRCDIAFEMPDGSVSYDDIEDPLPFDVDAPVVEISDEDYALFYRDLSEDMAKYEGKTVQFKGNVVRSRKLADNEFVLGRQLMTCCVEDIRFTGLICRYNGLPPKNKDWVLITARINNRKHKAYGKEGPVLTVLSMDKAEKPEQEVATFY